MHKLIDKYFSLICFLSLFAYTLAFTSLLKTKIHAEFHGIDPRARKLHDEYVDLAKKKNLNFQHTVTIGLKPLDRGNAIGLCWPYMNNREVDLDLPYWNKNSDIQRKILVFHELTHCYCGRDHDWAKGKKYPETFVEKKLRTIQVIVLGPRDSGYWEDGCAKSIMHPSIISDFCFIMHKQEYIDEMFDRCVPY